MNTENDIKEFGFRHISINTVYNGLAGNTVRCYHALLATSFVFSNSSMVLKHIPLMLLFEDF